MLGYNIDLYFHHYKLTIEIGEMVTVTEILTTEQKDKKQKSKNLVVSLLKPILTKKTLIFLKQSMNILAH